MSGILELLDFKLGLLKVEQDPFAESDSDTKWTLHTDFDVKCATDNPDRFLMILKLQGQLGAVKGEPPRPSYDVVGLGEFRTPSALPPEAKQLLVVFNGGLILYGLIRGQLAMVTGSFPSGSILLPTVEWKSIAREIIERKADAENTPIPAEPSGETKTPQKNKRGASAKINRPL